MHYRYFLVSLLLLLVFTEVLIPSPNLLLNDTSLLTDNDSEKENTACQTLGLGEDIMKAMNAVLKSSSFGNIVIDNSYTTEELVQDIFIAGTCFEVSNITYSGDASAIGAFTEGTMGIGLESGIVLSSGSTIDVSGPNNLGSTSTDFGYNTGVYTIDTDLETLANFPGGSNDVAALEFDFIPSLNTVSFDFVFASEEYPEFVDAGYNDAFGFFISGPGIAGPYANGAENIALIPGTTVPITIDNVSATTNSTYYNDNIGGANLEFDAYLDVLTATYTLTPCETYHIKLAVCDMFDGSWDSAVFLGAESFDAGAGANIASIVGSDIMTNDVFEGCSDGFFVFTRESIADLTTPVVITFDISGTAINGSDYVTIPNSITIPAGQTAAILSINGIEDGLTEGIEDVVLTITSLCTCDPPSVSIEILDYIPLTLSGTPETTLCPGETFDFDVNTDTGAGPFQYQWQTPVGSNLTGDSQSIVLGLTDAGTYTSTVTDACMNSQTFAVELLMDGCPCTSGNFNFIQD